MTILHKTIRSAGNHRNGVSAAVGSRPTEKDLALFADDVAALARSVSSVVVASPETVRLALTGLFAGGHILLEDLPGVGKTLLAKTIAQAIDCEFKRIQFTPDLLPSDVTGTSVFDMQAARFQFIPGPIFANIVLADEINRTGPRTQSALLEAMAEQQVSLEGKVRKLPEPFLVIATQNPLESHGTFPLPDSQMDRFLISMNMGLPSPKQETEILLRSQHGMPTPDTVLTEGRVREMRAIVQNVEVSLPVLQYIVSIVSATRTAPTVEMGVSPRGGAALQRAAQATAAFAGRGFVVPEDVRAAAPHVLAHRLIRSPMAEGPAVSVIHSILASTPVPA